MPSIVTEAIQDGLLGYELWYHSFIKRREGDPSGSGEPILALTSTEHRETSGADTIVLSSDSEAAKLEQAIESYTFLSLEERT